MFRGNRLLACAFALLLLAVSLRANGRVPQADRLRSSAASSSQAAVPAATTEYLGSASCERCHQKEYAAWKSSLHIKMTKPVAEASIVGDFRDGTKFSDHDRSYTFGTKNGKPFISISFG